MSLALRLFAAVAISVSFSSCTLIGAAIRTAAQMWPLLLMADEDGTGKENPEAMKARARQIHNLPSYDGRQDWIKNDKAAQQGLAAR